MNKLNRFNLVKGLFMFSRLHEESFNFGDKMTRKINYKERICECCGKIYKPTCATQKWCLDCGPKMRKELKKNYYKGHKEEHR